MRALVLALCIAALLAPVAEAGPVAGGSPPTLREDGGSLNRVCLWWENGRPHIDPRCDPSPW